MDIDLLILCMIEWDKDILFDYLLMILEDVFFNVYDKIEVLVNGVKVQLDCKIGNVVVMFLEKDEEGQVVGWYDGIFEDFGCVVVLIVWQVIF